MDGFDRIGRGVRWVFVRSGSLGVKASRGRGEMFGKGRRVSRLLTGGEKDDKGRDGSDESCLSRRELTGIYHSRPLIGCAVPSSAS